MMEIHHQDPSGLLKAHQLAAFLPQLGLQLGVVGELGRLRPLSVVEVAATHALQLGRNCSVDGYGRSFCWSLSMTRKKTQEKQKHVTAEQNQVQLRNHNYGKLKSNVNSNHDAPSTVLHH